MFGQYNTTKEANMYPKFMDDLQGWNVRDVACSGSGYLICADDSLIGSQVSFHGQNCMPYKNLAFTKVPAQGYIYISSVKVKLPMEVSTH